MNARFAAAFVAASLATGGLAVSQALGDEPAVVRQMAWNGGPSLDLDLPAKITFTQSPTVRFTVTGPNALVDRVSVDGGKVRIKSQLSWWGGSDFGSRGLKIDISAPHLNDVSLGSAGALVIGSLAEDTLNLDISSAASAKVNLNVRELHADVSSAGGLTATGSAGGVWLKVSSAGKADLRGVNVDSAQVRASSGAWATVNPRLSADAAASSGGGIRLLNRPTKLFTRTSSGGDVTVSN